MAKTQTQAEQAAEATVVNHGDVTERNMVVGPVSGDMIEIHPMSALPKSHKHLAGIYTQAKGFTEEGSTIALHF